MRCSIIAIMTFIYLSLSITITFAGECMDTEENFLGSIESADPKNENADVGWALYCLVHSTFYMKVNFQGFTGPETMDDIERWNEPYREKVFGIVPPFLDSPNEFIRCDAAKVLAYYKWPGSYEYLLKCPDDRQKVTIAAILGDKRATKWIIDRYRYFDRKYRSRPSFSYDDKINCLGALYYLGTPETIPFLEDIIANPKPEGIKKVALRVLSHINEQYPKTNESDP